MSNKLERPRTFFGGIISACLILSGCSTAESLFTPTPRIILPPTATLEPLKFSTPKPTQVIDQYAGVIRNPALGIRCNLPYLMKWVPRIGASWVRIVGDRETFEEKPEVKEALLEAYKQKLNILYTDNPQRLLSFTRIKDRINSFTNYMYLDAVELSNEPDNPIAPFWKDRDLRTLAVYTLIASNQIFETSPHIRVGIGAFVDPGNMGEFFEHLSKPDFTLLPDYNELSGQDRIYLKSLRFDPEKYFYGVHAYHSVEDVTDRIKTMRIVFEKVGISNPTVWMTEVGSQKSKKDMPLLLDKFYGSTGIVPGIAFIHELPDFEGYGYMNSETPNSVYFPLILAWSQNNQRLVR